MICLVCHEREARGDLGRTRMVCESCIATAERVALVTHATRIADETKLTLEEAMVAIGFAEDAIGMAPERMSAASATSWFGLGRDYERAMGWVGPVVPQAAEGAGDE